MSKIIPLFKNKEKEFKCDPCCELRNGQCWCPHIKWYLKDGCPFKNKNECDNYKEMCGKRI